MNPSYYFYFGSAIFVFVQLFLIIYKIKSPTIFYDIPNERSSHSTPILKVGGLVIFLNFYFLSFFFITSSPINQILFLSTLIFLISLLDDFFDISIYLRLFIHFVICAILIFFLDFDYLIVSIFFLISLVWITNLYNFMDGINGLSAFMTIFGFLPLGYISHAHGDLEFTKIIFLLVFLILPFLFFNFIKNKIFLGDAGAVTIGFIAGGVGLYGWKLGYWPLWFPTVLFSTFGADATLTVIMRVVYKKNPLTPHKTYFFHKLIDLGFSKCNVSLYYAIFMILSSLFSIILLNCPLSMIYLLLSIYYLFLLFILLFIHFKWLKLDIK
jgi:UDP-N-acetylmuramyl pentapeptide phosphotransferase/UDP-N-acetylglucosamine-1-phosphate transferase